MDDESELIPNIVGTAPNMAHGAQVDKLRHGAEHVIGTAARHAGVVKRI